MEDEELGKIMFYCGAQITPDGDLLPESFMVFSNSTSLNDAATEVIRKIGEQLIELDMPQGEGQMSFQSISSWQEFAEVKIPDAVKTQALVNSVMRHLAEFTAYTAERLVPVMQQHWTAPASK